MSAHPMNVLILHTDQQRYDSLGCAGNPYAVTPHLDQLAAAGTCFSRHIVSNPVCQPSRASLLTGLYPPGHNVWTNGVALQRAEYLRVNPRDLKRSPLPVETPTLADLFARAGYDTAAFGKLHLTPNLAPAEYGYQESWDLWRRGDFADWHGPYFGFRHFDYVAGHGECPCSLGHYAAWLEQNHPEVAQAVRSPDRQRPVPAMRDLSPSPVPGELHNSTWLADRLAEYLRQERPADRPFFAWVGFPDPHHPFTPSFDVVADFVDRPVPEPADPQGDGMRASPAWELAQHGGFMHQLTVEERRTVQRYTYAMVHQIDRAVGRIVTALQDQGLWENTIIIFTSDHGDFLGDHASLYKGIIASDSLLRVPFILRAPGAQLPAQVDAPMSNCDVAPTLAALTGVDLATGFHGRNIVPVARGKARGRALTYCYDGLPEQTNLTIYDERYRLTYYPGREYVELYDHAADPGECRNVAGEPAHREAREELLRELCAESTRHVTPTLARVAAW